MKKYIFFLLLAFGCAEKPCHYEISVTWQDGETETLILEAKKPATFTLTDEGCLSANFTYTQKILVCGARFFEVTKPCKNTPQ